MAKATKNFADPGGVERSNPWGRDLILALAFRRRSHSEEQQRRRISHGLENPQSEILRCAQDDSERAQGDSISTHFCSLRTPVLDEKKGTSRVKITTTSICLITSCAGLVLLGASNQPTARQRWQAAHAPVLSKRTGPIKRTWKSGPASLPLETERVSARPTAVPPQTSPLRVSRAKDNKVARTCSAGPRLSTVNCGRNADLKNDAALHTPNVKSRAPFVGPVRLSSGTAVGSTAKARTTYTVQEDATSSSDPESARTQNEFVRLRQDAAARRAFYNDLLGTVERERGGSQSENWAYEKPVSSQPAASPHVRSSTENANSQRPARHDVVTPAEEEMNDRPAAARPSIPAAIEPEKPTRWPDFTEPPQQTADKPPTPQSSLRRPGIDKIAYRRVVRWAKANDLPVSLALGVAWMGVSHEYQRASRSGRRSRNVPDYARALPP